MMYSVFMLHYRSDENKYGAHLGFPAWVFFD